MRISAIASIFLLLIVTTSHAGLFGPKIPTNVTYEVTNSELEPLATKLSKEQQHVLLAIEARIQDISLKNIKKSLNVNFANQAPYSINKLVQSFKVKRAVIMNMESDILTGFLEFTDDTHRLLLYMFDSKYLVKNGETNVELKSLSVITNSEPVATILVVPAARMNANTVGNYIATYNQAKSANITANSSKPNGMQKYIVLVFFKTLITPDLKPELRIANSENNVGDSSKSINRYYDQGWLVIANEVEMDLVSQSKWAKVVVNIGSETKVIAERKL